MTLILDIELQCMNSLNKLFSNETSKMRNGIMDVFFFHCRIKATYDIEKRLSRRRPTAQSSLFEMTEFFCEKPVQNFLSKKKKKNKK